jgi:oligopeptide/dipeptide ABC transporter ATP-binding protein
MKGDVDSMPETSNSAVAVEEKTVPLNGPLLNVRNLVTHFDTRRGPVKAVDGISYGIMPGEIVALVGESGCGKTVSALSMLRLVPEPPAKISGEAIFEGTDLLKLNQKELIDVRGRLIAIVFQEPMTSLNPILTVGRQLEESLVEHKLMQWDNARQEAVSLLERVGITDGEKRLGQYPEQFSGGMRQRLMLAIALSCKPRLIIADEPTTAVDVTVQAQLLELLCGLAQQSKVALLLITHNLGVVAKYADRVNVMYAGRIIERADTIEVFGNPLHPYTKALLGCIPRLDRDRQHRLSCITGQPPDLVRRPAGCPFWPRCSVVIEGCKTDWPPLWEVKPGHYVSCHHYLKKG